jgi:hypothetical protein
MLARCGTGIGTIALAGVLADDARAEGGRDKPGRSPDGAQDPLEPKKPHFAAKAKHVVHLFMNGGPSQVDTFDPKPELTKYHGKPIPTGNLRTERKTGAAMKSPFAFKRYGQSGIEVSELFAKTAAVHIDDMCVIRSMYADVPNHEPSLLLMNCGDGRQPRPSLGSWVTYGLGSENQNLPGFITLSPTLGHGGVQNWSSAFLPAAYQGTPVGNSGMPFKSAAVRDIQPAAAPDLQRMQLDLLQQMNRDHLAASGPDAALEGRINAYELAFRMQAEAPAVMDIAKESLKTLELYGIGEGKPTDNFGRQCLTARRLAEAGVRFIQCTHSYKWDQHANLKADHAKNALEVDRPIAALLADLKQRDLLNDTLVWWGGEFGRTPTGQGGDGRDHNPHAFSMWLAGGGVNGGMVHGATDDFGYYAVEKKVHMHDLHATILHLLGLDHEKLTFRYAGRDFRLTDVSGEVVTELFV